MNSSVYINQPLRFACDKFLIRHKPKTQRQWLQELLIMPDVDLEIDSFGSGPALELLESKMAKLLGKPRALFLHKGMIGQLCALKYHADTSGCNTIAIHPQSHIQVDELQAYHELLRLNAHFFGTLNKPFTLGDIHQLPSNLAAVCLELPTRHAGFQLPQWQDLETLNRHSKQNGYALHFDGARLFESAPYWNKSYRAITHLADSVYVSLYKSLGAMAGGIIAGDEHFIESLSPWKSRFGGDVNTVFPYVLSALWGIENYLPHIPDYCLRAKQLSQLLTEVFGQQAVPFEVQTNGFVLQLPIEKFFLDRAVLRYADKHKTWLFDKILDGPKRTSRVEIQVGNALKEWSDQEVVEALHCVISMADEIKK